MTDSYLCIALKYLTFSQPRLFIVRYKSNLLAGFTMICSFTTPYKSYSSKKQSFVLQFMLNRLTISISSFCKYVGERIIVLIGHNFRREIHYLEWGERR